jgi:hypothetical protein
MNREQLLHKQVELPTWRAGSKCSCGASYPNDVEGIALNAHRAQALGQRVEELQDAQDAMVKWLVLVVNYPIDFQFEEPVPESWREVITHAWTHDHPHGCTQDPESRADFALCVAEEGGWNDVIPANN